jgi:uncharacterized membrane-anchored protein
MGGSDTMISSELHDEHYRKLYTWGMQATPDLLKEIARAELRAWYAEDEREMPVFADANAALEALQEMGSDLEVPASKDPSSVEYLRALLFAVAAKRLQHRWAA